MTNKLDWNGFIQIALVVPDIEKAAKEWCALFGVPVPKIEIHEGTGKPELTYRGEPATYKIRITSIDTGRGFIIELHEVVEGESTFKEFKDTHGYGVHHLGFAVGERRDAVVDELAETYDLRTVGFYPGGSWTIVDSEKTLGVNLNIKPHI